MFSLRFSILNPAHRNQDSNFDSWLCFQFKGDRKRLNNFAASNEPSLADSAAGMFPVHPQYERILSLLHETK